MFDMKSFSSMLQPTFIGNIANDDGGLVCGFS